MTDAELDARFDKVFEAVHGKKVIDVYTPSFSQKWADAPFTHKLAVILIVGALLPWAIIVGGIVCLGIWDAIRR